MPNPDQYPYWLAAIMATLIGFLGKYHFNRINDGLDKKADRTEILELHRKLEKMAEVREQEAREARETRERDLERMERIANERYAELNRTINQRITAFESHVSKQLELILRHVEKRP